jgi:hypothetical protein
MASADGLWRELGELHAAAVGVVQLRTREPQRALQVLEDWAPSQELAWTPWSITTGMMGYPGTHEPAAALSAALAAPGKHLVAFLHPHSLLRDPLTVQSVLDACWACPASGSRIVLITPPTAILPDEIRGEVPVIDLALPDHADRLDALAGMLEAMGDASPDFPPSATSAIVSAGSGMTLTEFEVAVGRALVRAGAAKPDACRIAADVHQAKAAAVRRSEVLELMPSSRMDELGGMEDLKAWLRQRARCLTDEARAAGVETPRGMLLVGPPGTGKSAAARAAADLMNLPLVRLDVGRIFASLVGQSEGRLRDALAVVSAMAPCVLMVDEVDKAFDQRSAGGDSGVGRRVLGTLLTWMQEQAGAFVVFTANRVDGLPAELLRRGRIDEIWSIGLPSTGERAQVLRIHLKRRGHGDVAHQD